jgi:hypothetical protein
MNRTFGVTTATVALAVVFAAGGCESNDAAPAAAVSASDLAAITDVGQRNIDAYNAHFWESECETFVDSEQAALKAETGSCGKTLEKHLGSPPQHLTIDARPQNIHVNGDHATFDVGQTPKDVLPAPTHVVKQDGEWRVYDPTGRNELGP